MKIMEIIAEKASYALCNSGRADADLGASNLASCRSQGLRAREGNKSHLIGHGDSKVRVTVGGKKIKGKKYGGPLPDYGTRKNQNEAIFADPDVNDLYLNAVNNLLDKSNMSPLDKVNSLLKGKDSDSPLKALGKTDQEPAGQTGSALSNFKSKGDQVDPKVIKQYLISKGFDNNQAAGWLVNIKWETGGFKPGAYIKSDAGQGQSGGLFMFHDKVNGKGLFTQMVNYVGKDWQTNWQGQLNFAMADAKGQQYKNTKFPSAGAAAHWWVVNYEKPKDTAGQAAIRAKNAVQYA